MENQRKAIEKLKRASAVDSDAQLEAERRRLTQAVEALRSQVSVAEAARNAAAVEDRIANLNELAGVARDNGRRDVEQKALEVVAQLHATMLLAQAAWVVQTEDLSSPDKLQRAQKRISTALSVRAGRQVEMRERITSFMQLQTKEIATWNLSSSQGKSLHQLLAGVK